LVGFWFSSWLFGWLVSTVCNAVIYFAGYQEKTPPPVHFLKKPRAETGFFQPNDIVNGWRFFSVLSTGQIESPVKKHIVSSPGVSLCQTVASSVVHRRR
jgi:hypothetical protein